ncbi:MAG: ethanolamine utilization protein EutN, partial [Oscillospiraceae bacterium]|nr:ethanolamine utilization protein EutN [Oscillospiraceae bacterium]
MNIARVKGTVVSTNKAEKIMGMKLLVVKPIDLDTMQEKGSALVAV